MAVVKCKKGHYYDDEKYTSCPMCAKAEENDGDSKTVAMFSLSGKASGDDERTIGINFKKNGCDPVVGWLVCIEGTDKGRDFRLHSGRNFIGRDYKNDISLPYDKTVSRVNAGYIVYEPHKNIFLAANGEGAVISVNGKLLESPCVITKDDEIVIGSSKFNLAAYCKGDKKW